MAIDGNDSSLKQFKMNVPCQAACPIQTDVGGYIEAIVREDYEEAYRINRMDNVLPGVLGRVCHRPCEPACRHGREGMGEPIQICFLKRSAADFGLSAVQPKITPNGKSVCVVGSGPAGLTAANDLALRGFDVTVLEQFSEPGGMLHHSIPTFRLPEDVVQKDIQSILDLGVKLETNVRIDSREHLEDLQAKYDAVVFAAGCMVPSRLKLMGDIRREGFYWGLDFMMHSAHGELDLAPKNVVVIGGSYVAVDCARTCFRLGAREITMAYRRSKNYLKAGAMELEALDTEGVRVELMTSPVEIESDKGRITGVRMVKNELDDRGMAQPIKGSEFTIKADTVILAIGQEAEKYEMELGGDENPPAGLYNAGDFKQGSGTVVEACADGRAVARQVCLDLTGIQFDQSVTVEEVDVDDMPRTLEQDADPAEHMPVLPRKDRESGELEVELGLSREQALAEARRCYLCHYTFEINVETCIYCELCIEFSPVNCISMFKQVEEGAGRPEVTADPVVADHIAINQNSCIRCGECVSVCPTNCISVKRQRLQTIEL